MLTKHNIITVIIVSIINDVGLYDNTLKIYKQLYDEDKKIQTLRLLTLLKLIKHTYNIKREDIYKLFEKDDNITNITLLHLAYLLSADVDIDKSMGGVFEDKETMIDNLYKASCNFLSYVYNVRKKYNELTPGLSIDEQISLSVKI